VIRASEVLDLDLVERASERRHTGARRSTEFAWARACVTVDALMLGAAAATAELGAARAGIPTTPSTFLVAFSLLVLGLLWLRRLYAVRMSLRLLEDARTIVVSCAIAAMSIAMLRVLLGADVVAADQALRLCAFSAVYLVGGRAVLTWSELGARRAGETLRPTLIVGAGEIGRLTAKRLLGHPELGMRPVGFLDKDPVVAREDDVTLPVLGASWDLEAVVRDHDVEQVIVTFSKAPHDVLLRLARRCEDLGVRIAYVPRLFDRMTERVTVDHLVGLPLLTAEFVNPKSWQFAVKYAIDRLVAAFLIALVAPVMLAAAAAVYLSLGRPVLFRQIRVGRDGRSFEMLKFRSMRCAAGTPAEAVALPADTAPGGVEGEDLRTRVGDVLRRTSIDELPQLFNVLRGDMSLIGPRPERPAYVGLFGRSIRRYDDRHRVKSGITGWAQVNGLRGKTSISERAELDNYYVQNWSLWLDVKILLMTLAAVVTSYRSVE
jgi:exopolysaccharide biosynthesis polyprenyl glycosylphosphotransferase